MISGVLSDRSIKDAIQMGHINIDPYDESLVQPASIDVRLGGDYLINATYSDYKLLDKEEPEEIDLSFFQNNLDCLQYVKLSSDFFRLRPKEFILASTLESISLPSNIVARVEGKSSLGRLGLLVHATAGFCDPGFQGKITLELYNLNSKAIVLETGMLIAQLSFMRMDSPAEYPYGHSKLNSHYQNQEGVMYSKYGEVACEPN